MEAFQRRSLVGLFPIRCHYEKFTALVSWVGFRKTNIQIKQVNDSAERTILYMYVNINNIRKRGTCLPVNTKYEKWHCSTKQLYKKSKLLIDRD